VPKTISGSGFFIGGKWGGWCYTHKKNRIQTKSSGEEEKKKMRKKKKKTFHCFVRVRKERTIVIQIIR